MRNSDPGLLRRTGARLLAGLAAVPAALWIVRHETIIRRSGRRLRPEETAFARELGIHNPGEVRVLAVATIPSPLGGLLAPLENLAGFSLAQSAGVTLGRGIYVADRCESPALIRHELVHVRQYERMGGPLPFIYRYFCECLAHGYWEAPLEREAVRRSER